MNPTTLKKLRTGAAETAVGSLLAVVFLGGLLATLNLVFPDATGIGQLVRAPGDDGARTTRLDLSDLKEPPIVARLIDVRNTVKDRPATSVTWASAGSGLALRERHSVQSYGRSGATLAFDDGNTLSLGENTLIVVRGMTPERAGRVPRVSLMFAEGELRGSLTDKSGKGMQLELVTGGATVRAAADYPETNFKVASGPADATILVVYDGKAEVLWGGETTVVDADHTVEFSAVAPPSTPRRIPATPLLVAPVDGQRYAYRGAAPEVQFQWLSDESGLRYRLQIARDEGFEDIVYEERTDRTTFVHGALEANEYFWRVTAFRDLVEGRSSPLRRVELAIDGASPTLQVAFPDADVVRNAKLLLRGVTEPNSAVLIGKVAIEVDSDGSFEHMLALRNGYNLVVVQAVDRLGNTAFESRMINASY